MKPTQGESGLKSPPYDTPQQKSLKQAEEENKDIFPVKLLSNKRRSKLEFQPWSF